MERLTYDFCIGGNHCWQVKGADNLECREVCQCQEDKGCKDCPIAKAFDRLAAYEETGLEPEEIDRILDAYGRGMTLRTETAQRLEIVKDIKTTRLRELAQADREGKISKYTIGDAIYDRFGDAWEVRTAELHLLGEKPDWMYRCGHAGTDDYCALWSFEILTHEEAAISALRPISRECGNKAEKKIVQEVLKND